MNAVGGPLARALRGLATLLLARVQLVRAHLRTRGAELPPGSAVTTLEQDVKQLPRRFPDHWRPTLALWWRP